jgi:hypothetical protein
VGHEWFDFYLRLKLRELRDIFRFGQTGYVGCGFQVSLWAGAEAVAAVAAEQQGRWDATPPLGTHF